MATVEDMAVKFLGTDYDYIHINRYEMYQDRQMDVNLAALILEQKMNIRPICPSYVLKDWTSPGLPLSTVTTTIYQFNE